MTRETAEHVAELAAFLAQCDESRRDEIRNYDPHSACMIARHAVTLCALSRKAHRFSERACNVGVSDEASDRFYKRNGAKVAAILDRFGLAFAWQTDPRGWPLLIFPTAEARDAYETHGTGRESLRVTPNA